jgi:hypothetical protein
VNLKIATRKLSQIQRNKMYFTWDFSGEVLNTNEL